MLKLFLPLLIIFFLINHLSASEIKVIVQKPEIAIKETKFSAILEKDLTLEIGKRENYTVISGREVEKIYTSIKLNNDLKCEESKECLISLKQKLNSDILLSSKLGKLSGEFILTIISYNVKKGSLLNRFTFQGKSYKELRSQLPVIINVIFGKNSLKPAFKLETREKISLAVFPLENHGVDKSVTESVSEILNSHLNQIENVSVISQNDVRTIIDKSLIDSNVLCIDNLQCIVEIGAAFGTSKVVYGTIGKIEDDYIISLGLIDTRKAKVLSRVVESYSGSESELKNAIKIVALKMLGIDFSKEKGSVNFSFNIKNEKALLNMEKKSIENNQFIENNIIPGRHTLKIFPDDDFYPLITDIYVVPKEINKRKFKLLEKPQSWYKTWWFWTGIGAIVAASTVSTVYFMNMETKKASAVIEF